MREAGSLRPKALKTKWAMVCVIADPCLKCQHFRNVNGIMGRPEKDQTTIDMARGKTQPNIGKLDKRRGITILS
jgi:hypothetical protein